MTGAVEGQDLREAFERCGFGPEDVERGLRMSKSGEYADFTDVAISLSAFSNSGRRVQELRIAEVAGALSVAGDVDEPAPQGELQVESDDVRAGVSSGGGEAVSESSLDDLDDRIWGQVQGREQ